MTREDPSPASKAQHVAPAWPIRQEYGLKEGRYLQLVLRVTSSARVTGEMCPLFHSTPNKEDVNLGVTTEGFHQGRVREAKRGENKDR